MSGGGILRVATGTGITALAGCATGTGEMTYCNAELLEMQTQHAASVAVDTKDRTVQMAMQSEASLEQQMQEQSLQLQQAEQRKDEIATAEIKLQAALKRGNLSELDTKDAE
eukprot:COSAG01_NODE_51907_length_351_cov_0.472222_1_plen_111_part_01